MTTKTLYLVRHGRAEERGQRWPDDRLRPLTRDGIRRMERTADGLASQGFEADVILSSSLVRARETARILGERTSGRPKVHEVSWLEPGTSPEEVATGLAAFSRAKRVVLVGHEPEIGELAGWLLGAGTPMPFRKGAVACFEVSTWPLAPPARLLWFAPAKLLAGSR